MLRNLPDYGSLSRRLQLQLRQQLTDFFIPFTHVQPPSPKKCTVGCPTCGGLNNEPFSCYLASWLSSPPQVGQPTVLSAAPFHSFRFAPETPGTISGQSESFAPERHHRVNFGRSPSREPAREQRDADQQQRDRAECQRVNSAHPVEQVRKEARQSKGGGQADSHADQSQQQSFADHQLQHISSPSAQRHANADFTRPPGDRISDQSGKSGK